MFGHKTEHFYFFQITSKTFTCILNVYKLYAVVLSEFYFCSFALFLKHLFWFYIFFFAIILRTVDVYAWRISVFVSVKKNQTILLCMLYWFNCFDSKNKMKMCIIICCLIQHQQITLRFFSKWIIWWILLYLFTKCKFLTFICKPTNHSKYT